MTSKPVACLLSDLGASTSWSPPGSWSMGPGAIARNARLRYSTAPGSPPGSFESTEVQVRDLALHDQLAGVSALEVTP